MAQNKIAITIGNKTLSCSLVSNSATSTLLERLAESDVTYDADDYGGFEKVGYIGFSLPTSNEQITTKPGDVVLYNGNNICIFVGQNSWSYTPLGKIEGIDINQLKSFLHVGEGSVKITLSRWVPSSVGHIKNEEKRKSDDIFSLNGQKLHNTPTGGIYIENGIKKIKK
ncbi:MAG: cyclophilin-like fold protein [Bacteroidales bacterium]|nr:cyclophilin-like fold protein [Bacteroidales bacterium]